MKIILITIMLILMSSLCLADAEINMTIVADGDINSTITEVATGDINTDIHCYGATCTTNLYDGNVNLPNETHFDFNDYRVTNKRGLTFRKFLNTANLMLNRYVTDNKPQFNHDGWNFWEMLDIVFVSHNEFEFTRMNTYYLGEQIDMLKAENKLLRTHLNITYNPELLECQAGIEKAKRIGQKITTENGFKVDINAFGETCIKIN